MKNQACDVTKLREWKIPTPITITYLKAKTKSCSLIVSLGKALYEITSTFEQLDW